MVFIDKLNMYIRAGKGGDGCVSFHREKYVAAGGPDGGDGGRGGNIVFVADKGKNTLLDYKNRRRHIAQDGEKGGTKKFSGKSGIDLILPVPEGTIIKDLKTGKVIHDMSESSPFIAARGGKGGWGNVHFATPTRQAPHFAKNGMNGEELDITLELKMLADIGLAGFPNAGKSTLLSKISAATPKIADYPFTTLTPILGVVSAYEHTFVVADIPGLIEGAAEGAGLGHDFLRHIERCRLLVNLFDLSAGTGEDVVENIVKIRHELEKFSKNLAAKPMLLVGNKKDSVYDDEVYEAVKQYAAENNMKYLFISALTGEGIDELKNLMWNEISVLPPIDIYQSEEMPVDTEYEKKSKETIITVEDGVYHVTGEWIKRAAGSIYFDDRESFNYFQKILKNSGVFEALEERGINQGDTVEIYGLEFEYCY